MSDADGQKQFRFFQPARSDLIALHDLVWTRRAPFSPGVLLLRFLERRLETPRDSCMPDEVPPEIAVYHRSGEYEVGQELYLPSQRQIGRVSAKNSWLEPDLSARTSLRRAVRVRLSRQELVLPCADPSPPPLLPSEAVAADWMEQAGGSLWPLLERRLQSDRRFMCCERLWLTRDLLVEPDTEDLAAARELLVDMGVALTTAQIAELLFQDAHDPLRCFSLCWALQQAHESQGLEMLAGLPVRWKCQAPPSRTSVGRGALGIRNGLPFGLARSSQRRSRRAGPGDALQRVRLSIPVGFRESGCLPLTEQVQSLFPAPAEAEEASVELVDTLSGREFSGSVLYTEGCVSGLAPWLDMHRIPTGGVITVERTAKPRRVLLDFVPCLSAVEYQLRALVWERDGPQGRTVSFTPHCEVDEEKLQHTVLFDRGADRWSEATDSLFDLLCLACNLLEATSAANPLHVREATSVVSYVRRSTPLDVWSILTRYPCFRQIEGQPHFWWLDVSQVLAAAPLVGEDEPTPVLVQLMRIDLNLRALRREIQQFRERTEQQSRQSAAR